MQHHCDSFSKNNLALFSTVSYSMSILNKHETFFQVQVIDLRGEPSCSMQSLSKCPELRSLTLQNCGLLAVKGLDKCKELQELHLEVSQSVWTFDIKISWQLYPLLSQEALGSRIVLLWQDALLSHCHSSARSIIGY